MLAGTSTIWQVKPGLQGTAANLVCFSGECTQPACLGARPNLGGSHAGLKFTPRGPPAIVTRSASSFLLFPGWTSLFPGTNRSLLHVTTCSDALHDIGWTGRHFVSSGNGSAPETWAEAALDQSPSEVAASGSWRHATSCVPTGTGAALRCIGYDLHCQPDAAPCAPSTTGYINTTTYELDSATGKVRASDGGLASYTFSAAIEPNHVENCTGSECPRYTYNAYPGAGLAHRVRSGGFMQLVGATMAAASRGAMFAMTSTTGSAWRSLSEVPEGDCPGLGENDWTYQSDNVTMLAVFRNAGPAGTLCASRSTTEGRAWSVAKMLQLPQPNNVLPRLVTLANGLITLSTGRIGLFVYVSADNASSWHSLDVSLNHNIQTASIGDRYSQAFVRGAGDSTMSTSYTSLVHYDGTNIVQVCYDRLANGWDPVSSRRRSGFLPEAAVG